MRLSGVFAVIILFAIMLAISYQQTTGKIENRKQVEALIQDDQGLQTALNNGYIQVVNTHSSQNGFTLTAEQVMLDDRRLLIFYSIENEEAYPVLTVENIRLASSSEKLEGYALTYEEELSLEGQLHRGMLDFSWNEDVRFGHELTLSLTVRDEPLSVSFPVNTTEIAEPITYEFNQEYEIDGEVIRFKKLISYPTQAVLHIEFAEQNDMKFIELSDLRLASSIGQTV